MLWQDEGRFLSRSGDLYLLFRTTCFTMITYKTHGSFVVITIIIVVVRIVRFDWRQHSIGWVLLMLMVCCLLVIILCCAMTVRMITTILVQLLVTMSQLGTLVEVFTG